jgi:hypothetical protein
MSRKARKEKLGRNPFEEKPAKKHKPVEEPAPARAGTKEQESADRTNHFPSDHTGEQHPLIAAPRQIHAEAVPASAALAWLFVDLWTSSIFEPMFFWMNSPRIVRETMKAASGRKP